MFKTNKTETLYLHTSREKKLFRSWFRYRKFATHLEISTSRTGPSVRLHLGNASSETPVDWHISLIWISFYGSLDWPGLGKFCGWIGRGHKRDLSLSVFGGQLWWKLWYDDDGGYDDYHKHDLWKKPVLPPWCWGRKKYRSWMCLRNGNIDLNPVNAFWGFRRYNYTNIDMCHTVVGANQFSGDMQEVKLTLQSVVQKRDAGPAWARRPKWIGYSVAWDCRDGIPTQNHDWKGDCVYGSSVSAKDPIDMEHWKNDAVIALTNWIIKDRKRNNYRPRIGENNG